MSEFRDFALGTAKGLLEAFKSDHNVFLLGVAGIAAGAPTRSLRAFAGPLMLYVIFRRADDYFGRLDGHLFQVNMNMSNCLHLIADGRDEHGGLRGDAGEIPRDPDES